MSIDSKIRDVANKSKVNIIIPIVLTLGICGLILMFSIEQSFPVNSAGQVSVLGGQFSGWYNDVCENRLVNKLSPFLFNMRIDVFSQEIGIMGCPWRIRNTVYRLVTTCLMIIILLWMLAMLIFSKKLSKIWKFLYYIYYILFFAMIVVLILDIDGVWNGYVLCGNNFDTQVFENNQGATLHVSDNNLIINLINIQWRTTMPPWCPQRAFNGLSTDYEMDNFKIVDKCYLTPFIYTCITDFVCMILSYIIYRLTSVYMFGQDPNDPQQPQQISIKKRKKNKTKKKTKKKESISMAEFDGNNRRNMAMGHQSSTINPGGGAIMSPAYNVEKSLYDHDHNIKL